MASPSDTLYDGEASDGQCSTQGYMAIAATVKLVLGSRDFDGLELLRSIDVHDPGFGGVGDH